MSEVWLIKWWMKRRKVSDIFHGCLRTFDIIAYVWACVSAQADCVSVCYVNHIHQIWHYRRSIYLTFVLAVSVFMILSFISSLKSLFLCRDTISYRFFVSSNIWISLGRRTQKKPTRSFVLHSHTHQKLRRQRNEMSQWKESHSTPWYTEYINGGHRI